MYAIFEELCKKRRIKPSVVSRETGISTATLSSWKNGKYTPKQDKLQKIADYFGVSVEYLMTGEQPSGFYVNGESAEIAQAIYSNPHLKALFETASKNTTPEQLKFVDDLLKMMKQTNPDG